MNWYYSTYEDLETCSLGGFSKNEAIAEAVQQIDDAEDETFFWLFGGKPDIIVLSEHFDFAEWWRDNYNQSKPEEDEVFTTLAGYFDLFDWWEGESQGLDDRFWEELNYDNLIHFFNRADNNEAKRALILLNATLKDTIKIWEEKNEGLINYEKLLDTDNMEEAMPKGVLNEINSCLKMMFHTFEIANRDFIIDTCRLEILTDTFEVTCKAFTGLKLPYRFEMERGDTAWKVTEKWKPVKIVNLAEKNSKKSENNC